jgi:hypothetical protein
VTATAAESPSAMITQAIAFTGAGVIRSCTLQASGAMGASFGIWENYPPPNAVQAYDSVIGISGTGNAVQTTNGSGSLQFANCEFIGNVTTGGGSTETCVDCYTGSFTALSSTCQ